MTVFVLCSRNVMDSAHLYWTDFKTLMVYSSKEIAIEDMLYLRKEAYDRNCFDFDYEVLEFFVRDSTFFKQ